MTVSPIPGLSDAQALAHRRAVRRHARLNTAIDRLAALRLPDGEVAGAAVLALELLQEYRAEVRAELERTRPAIAAALEADR